jgi:hypothetical protein
MFVSMFESLKMIELEGRNQSLAKRIFALRRAYAVGLGHKPSIIQDAAMRRAATLQAQSEFALNDPAMSVNDKVRLDNAARRAIRDMQSVLHSDRQAMHA